MRLSGGIVQVSDTTSHLNDFCKMLTVLWAGTAGCNETVASMGNCLEIDLTDIRRVDKVSKSHQV